MLGIVAGQGILGQQLHKAVIAEVGTVVGPDIGVPDGVAAHPDGLQALQVAAQVILGLLGHGVALRLGLVHQRSVAAHALHGLLHQVVIPSLAALLVINLVLGGGIKGGHSYIQVILLKQIVAGGIEVILHVHGGVVFSVDGHRGHGAGQHSGVPNNNGNRQDGAHHAHHGIQNLAAPGLLGLLLPLLLPGRGPLDDLVLTGLLLSGCTHGFVQSSRSR